MFDPNKQFKQPDGTYKIGSYTLKQVGSEWSAWALFGPKIKTRTYAFLEDAIWKAKRLDKGIFD